MDNAGYLIKLNASDLQYIQSRVNCGTATIIKQYRSRSHIIILTSDGYVIKFIYDLNEVVSMHCISSFLTTSSVNIVPDVTFAKGFVYSKYKQVLYDPLDIKEAALCFGDFLLRVNAALGKIHDCGFAHNDVRLPNICFSAEFDVIFIDFDRATELDVRYIYESGMGCMYDDITGNSATVDMVQFGWMAADILEPAQDYHARKWATQSQFIKDNRFLAKLIQFGDCDAALLSKQRGTHTLQQVLTQRQQQT